jgi:hypothetical protein
MTTFNGEHYKPSLCSAFQNDHCGGTSGIRWPEAPPIPPETDPIIARELSKLTAMQREKLYEEIHGVIDIPKETPDFVNGCLDQMEEEINKIKKRAAYNKAHFLAPSMVKSRKFRIMFLRATSFDPRLAAKRIVVHFEYKAELFGDDKVAQQLTLDDLDDDDLASLEGGSFQLLPGTDTAGRSVGLFARKFSTFKTWQNGVRVCSCFVRSWFIDLVLWLLFVVVCGWKIVICCAIVFQTRVWERVWVSSHCFIIDHQPNFLFVCVWHVSLFSILVRGFLGPVFLTHIPRVTMLLTQNACTSIFPQIYEPTNNNQHAPPPTASISLVSFNVGLGTR